MSIGFFKLFYFFEISKTARPGAAHTHAAHAENLSPGGSCSFQRDGKYGTLAQVIKL
jgi:hypothetical protein